MVVTFGGTALATEFINLVSSEANEISTKEDKKTISPEHVMNALTVHCPTPLFLTVHASAGFLSQLEGTYDISFIS